jgi:predicted ATPase
MAAISSVEIENFRCFKKLRVDGLARVNVIVGANNSGKSALLEAIETVVSHENPFSMYRASIERWEFRRRREEGRQVVELDLRHWFHGHRLVPGTAFRLRTTGELSLSVMRAIEKVPSNAPSPPFMPAGLQLTLERPGSVPYAPFPLTEDGWLGVGPFRSFNILGLHTHPPVGFMPTERVDPGDLSQLWTDIVLTPDEERTIEALRLIDPMIDRIAISESDGAIAKVLLRGATGPVPLGTLGEGVSRILAMALYLVRSRAGFLLIDEIENGLHWSVMPKVWRFLVETALARDVQVFATTHSKDWLEGLAGLHRTHPELAAQVSVHRLEQGRETSVRFDAGDIAKYIEMELEAR